MISSYFNDISHKVAFWCFPIAFTIQETQNQQIVNLVKVLDSKWDY